MGEHRTPEQAAQLRQRWGTGHASKVEIDQALVELEQLLRERDRAARLLRRLATGPWPAMKTALTNLEAWLEETAPPVIPPPKPSRGRRGR